MNLQKGGILDKMKKQIRDDEDIDRFLDFIEERRENIQRIRSSYMPSGKENNEPEYPWIVTTAAFRRFKYGE